ncbi:MAG: c-type cytochrome [Myxococcota bacterium]
MANVDEHDSVQGRLIHEYDGIYEADNGLPAWLTAIFFGTTAFAVAYWFYYQEYEVGPQPAEQYAAAMEERGASVAEVSEEELEQMAADPEAVAEGQTLYASNCAACHGAEGEGQIGPNLTDAHWIHGGSPSAIHDTVHDGVAAKGMPAWGPVLGADGVQQVTAYLLSIRGTNVEGKAPEGEPWEEDAAGGEGDAADEPAGEADEPAAAEDADAEEAEEPAREEPVAGPTAARLE